MGEQGLGLGYRMSLGRCGGLGKSSYLHRPMEAQETYPELEIVFENEALIAINKPHGLLVHRSRIARDAKVFALQLLRDQIGQRVYPVHRLDRKTSGVLLFAKDPETHSRVQALFQNREVRKVYHALVRGYIEPEGRIDYALREEDGEPKTAITAFKRLARYELPISSGKFPSSRYSLVELYPQTGRFHQLRKHMTHCFHPIIGDRPHGCNKQNRFWKQQFGMTHMLLHAAALSFAYPADQAMLIQAEKSEVFQGTLQMLGDYLIPD